MITETIPNFFTKALFLLRNWLEHKPVKIIMCVKPSVHISDILSNLLFGKLYYKEGKVSICQRMNDTNIKQGTQAKILQGIA